MLVYNKHHKLKNYLDIIFSLAIVRENQKL